MSIWLLFNPILFNCPLCFFFYIAEHYIAAQCCLRVIEYLGTEISEWNNCKRLKFSLSLAACQMRSAISLNNFCVLPTLSKLMSCYSQALLQCALGTVWWPRFCMLVPPTVHLLSHCVPHSRLWQSTFWQQQAHPHPLWASRVLDANMLLLQQWVLVGEVGRGAEGPVNVPTLLLPCERWERTAVAKAWLLSLLFPAYPHREAPISPAVRIWDTFLLLKYSIWRKRSHRVCILYTHCKHKPFKNLFILFF